MSVLKNDIGDVTPTSHVVLWRVAVAISFFASIARSGRLIADVLPDLAWLIIQFGPLAAMLVFMFAAGRSTPRAAERRINLWLTLFVVAAFASAVASAFVVQSLTQWALLLPMFGFLASTMSRRWRSVSVLRGDMAFLFTLLCLTQLLGLAGLAAGYQWPIGDYGRFVGVLWNANYVGLQCAPGILLGVYVAQTAEGRQRVIAVLGIVILFAALVLSGSRGALVALGAGALALLAFRESRKSAVVVLAVVAAIAVYSVLHLVAPPAEDVQAPVAEAPAPVEAPAPAEAATGTPAAEAPVPVEAPAVEETETVVSQEPGGSAFIHTPEDSDITAGRLEIWENLLALWREDPWFGIGFRTTGLLSETDYYEAHNIYLSALVETGIFGGIAFMVLIVMIMRAGTLQSVHRVLIGAPVAVLVGELFESSILGWGGPFALSAWLMLLAWAAVGSSAHEMRSDGAASGAKHPLEGPPVTNPLP
ncbi:MAG: O-antigen ligase family protein [Coriobacteriia bacterium]